MNISIALDGPSGAGKSTVADQVAERLQILHLDTGAMYRAFAWEALQRGISTRDEAALVALTKEVTLEVDFQNGGQRTLINGADVTDLIRTQEISMAASDVSKFEEVRRFMVKMQQELAKSCSMILDGRDIGLTVLPDAMLKIFLTASPEERAKRRALELAEKGEPVSYEDVLEEVKRRDLQDTTRAVDPLRPADDAIVVDSTNLSREETVETILSHLEQKKIKAASALTKQSEKKEVSRKTEKRSWVYQVVRFLCWPVFSLLFPVKYHFVEKLQIDAPFILIGNHESMLDPLVVAWKCRRYQVRFFGKKELLKNPILKVILDSIHMIAVDRYNMDMAAVRACMKSLKEGHSLCIFPEGTRYKEGLMQDLESGVAMIAIKGKVPLLPAYISDKPRLFRKVHCYYGDPIFIEDYLADGCSKENIDRLLETIRHTYGKFQEMHSQSDK